MSDEERVDQTAEIKVGKGGAQARLCAMFEEGPTPLTLVNDFFEYFILYVHVPTGDEDDEVSDYDKAFIKGLREVLEYYFELGAPSDFPELVMVTSGTYLQKDMYIEGVRTAAALVYFMCGNVAEPENRMALLERCSMKLSDTWHEQS